MAFARYQVIGTFFDWLRDRKRRRVWSHDLAARRRGEDLAHRFLRRRGFTIVARNYRLASGDAEADLIARDGDALVIVEVKSRASDEYGPPERAIGEDKRRHLLRVAREYSRKSGTPWEKVRFDVVTVLFTTPPKIELFRDALSKN
ncbi:MAG TPA: YraN family protein [Bryobacteraceae bacterium]|nr:YraN family protein [Bryobacteraceae bacterium]